MGTTQLAWRLEGEPQAPAFLKAQVLSHGWPCLAYLASEGMTGQGT